MNADSKLSITGTVEAKSYDTDDLPNDWDSMSDKEKLEATKSLEPVDEVVDHNTTVRGMHEYFAINLDRNQSLQEDIQYLAIGNDDTDPQVTNSTLNNRVFEKEVTDVSQSSNEVVASTFIDEGEANGSTFREVGLFAGADASDRMWNHSAIANIEKDTNRTITLDITLTFDAA